MRFKNSILWLLLGLPIAVIAEPSLPLSGSWSFEINNSSLLNKHDDSDVRHRGYFKSELETNYHLNKQFSVFSKLVFEPVASGNGDVQLFEQGGLYLEEAALVMTLGEARAVLGKFNPAFGLAWDAAPGMYGDDFTDDYEITEQLGVSVQLPLDSRQSQQLSIAVFTPDSSVLSDSLFTKRGRWRYAGEGDTGISYSVALDGSTVVIPGLRYHLAYRELPVYDDLFVDNRGYAGTLLYALPLSETAELQMLYEWVAIDYRDGSWGDIRYQTPALTFSDGPLSIGLSRTAKRIEADETLAINQLDIRYYFAADSYWSVGFKQQQMADNDYYFFGLRLKTQIDF